ncbi:hypothetical protein AHAS_Ahas19G0247100 [Arachis hypogaea]
MNAHGIPTSKIVGYMVGTDGGYSLVGFLKKDVYNYADKSRRKQIVDDDANTTIEYLKGKAVADPMSIVRYNLTDNGRLRNMIWADGGGRIDYQYFGDVHAFESTYKKSKYRRPILIFSSSNNHKQTPNFGFGILMDENVMSYCWMLENLLEVMCQKKPFVVITNGKKTMIKDVKSIFPNATHQLCAWHVEKNVTSNVKDEELRKTFCRWLYVDMQIQDFEIQWTHIMEEYCLHDKPWAVQTHEKSHMFFVTNVVHLMEILEGLVLKGWRIDAKSLQSMSTMRIITLEEDYRVFDGASTSIASNDSIRDPLVAKTKGATKLPKKGCGGSGGDAIHAKAWPYKET